LAGCGDHVVRILDPATGAARKLGEHSEPVVAVAYNPDGTAAVTGGKDGVRLWQASSGQTQAFKAATVVSSVAFAQQNDLIVTGSEQGPARLWNTETGEPLGLALTHGNRRVMAAAFTPNGKSVLSGSSDRTLRLWELPGADPDNPLAINLTRVISSPNEVYTLAYSADGTTLLASGADECRCWEVPRGAVARHSLTHEDEVNKVTAAYSPDGKTILMNSSFRTYRWDAETGNLLPFPAFPNDARAMAYSLDGKVALLETDFCQTQLWNVTRGEAIGAPMTFPSRVTVARFSPNGNSLLTVCNERVAQLWAVDTGQQLADLPHEAVIKDVAYSPDGGLVVTATGNMARAWKIPEGREEFEFSHDGGVNVAAFTRDGQVVATGSQDKTCRLWTREGKPIAKLEHNGFVSAVAFSPDAKLVLTGSTDGFARLWETATGTPLHDAFEHRAAVSAVGFSHNGRFVLTGCEDGTVRLWHVSTGKAVGPPFQQDAKVHSVAFAPNGERVLTGSNSNYARVWDVPVPLRGEAESITRWVEYSTGMELDATGAVRYLTVRDWQERQNNVKPY
jgi:WD40 repeat protein